MPVAPLLAPGGVEMRVVSQVAAFTWGSWSVSWPEGFEPPDPPAEDRELGWVADLGGVEVEPFGRCFVRADAQIDATLGRSNVEDVLDAAKYRTSGEVFLETEIPFENLAGQLPYRDFDVNSLVPVRVGGRILEDQLVTKVEESEDEQGNRTATTYIGGQKFQDREALRTRNREIDRVIAQERLERGDEIGARLAASQEYEREQRENLKKYVDTQDDKVSDYADEAASTAETNAKTHAEDEDKKLKRAMDERVGPEGTLTRQVRELNADYTAKLGENGTVIADQAEHQRMLEGIVYGKPVSELDGTAFKEQQQAVNEMSSVFRDKQMEVNKGFEHLFGINEKTNLVQDYTIKHNQIMAEAYAPKKLTFMIERNNAGELTVPHLFENPLFSRVKSIGETSETVAVWFEPTFKRHKDSDNFLGVFTLETKGRVEYRPFNSPIIFNSGRFQCTFPKPDRGWLVVGLMLPYSLLSLYQEQLDALSAEYRAKGLRV